MSGSRYRKPTPDVGGAVDRGWFGGGSVPTTGARRVAAICEACCAAAWCHASPGGQDVDSHVACRLLLIASGIAPLRGRFRRD